MPNAFHTCLLGMPRQQPREAAGASQNASSGCAQTGSCSEPGTGSGYAGFLLHKEHFLFHISPVQHLHKLSQRH